MRERLDLFRLRGLGEHIGHHGPQRTHWPSRPHWPCLGGACASPVGPAYCFFGHDGPWLALWPLARPPSRRISGHYPEDNPRLQVWMTKHLQQLALDHADIVDDLIAAAERMPTPVSFREGECE